MSNLIYSVLAEMAWRFALISFGEGISWVIVDEVFFVDETPWSPTADGVGDSLHRPVVSGPGVDPGSWSSDVPSPGAGGGLSDMFLWITSDGGQLKLQFDLLPGYSYTIEVCTNLHDVSWVDHVVVAFPATEHLINLSPGTGPAFFRVRRE